MSLDLDEYILKHFCHVVLQSYTMAKMVKAIRMILGMEYFSSAVKLPPKDELDIEIEDEVPERKPSLEELDPLEVSNFLFQYHFF